MLEAKELFVKSIEEKFLSSQKYLSCLEEIFEKSRSEGVSVISDNLSFLRDVTRVVFGIETEDEAVVSYWNDIFRVKAQFPSQDLRIIAFEYFLTKGVLINPKVMEMERFLNFVEVMFQDHKTYAYNYYMLKVLVAYEIEKIRRYGGCFSILMMDLDNFKYYNDRYGHQFGDEILSGFSNVVLSCIRRSDILFRYGGDEFVVFCPETRRIGARVVAEKVRSSVNEYFREKDLSITVSIGIASFPFDGESFEEIISVADRMLYHSKRSGKNKVTDRFDYVEEGDRRKFPRVLVNRPSYVVFRTEKGTIEGSIVDISKGGMLIKLNCFVELGEIVELHEIRIGESEYVLDVFVKVSRVEGNFLAIDFRENKVFETIIYLFER